MNTIVIAVAGGITAIVAVVGGVQGYKAASIDTDSVPTIVNGSTVTYGDD